MSIGYILLGVSFAITIVVLGLFFGYTILQMLVPAFGAGLVIVFLVVFLMESNPDNDDDN